MGNIWGIIKTTLNSLTSFKETNINNKTAVTWYSRISAAKIYLLLTKTKEQIKSFCQTLMYKKISKRTVDLRYSKRLQYIRTIQRISKTAYSLVAYKINKKFGKNILETDTWRLTNSSTKLDNICFQEVQVIHTNKNSHQPYSASGQDYLTAFE